MNEKNYETLGLKPNTGIEKVKHRYGMIMKRSLHDESLNIKEITKAYDNIIKENTVDYFNADAELLDEKGLNSKKIKNFIFQNKLRMGFIIWITIGLLLLAYILLFQAGNIGLTPDTVPVPF